MDEPPARFVTDFLGPEYDSPTQHLGGYSYVICSTPRSGSGLLSRGLASTGVLGAPLEYLNPVHRQRLSQRWGCGQDLDDYVKTLHARRSTASGIFGAKVHWDQMSQIRAEATATADERFVHTMPDGLFDRLFPSPRFIRIIRLDLDQQAVSFWRALKSNVWSLGVDDQGAMEDDQASYQYEGIDNCRRVIENGELCWDRLIRERGDAAMVVTYEELATSFADVIRRVSEYIAPGVGVKVSAPTTKKLSNEHSVRLVNLYRAERLRRT